MSWMTLFFVPSCHILRDITNYSWKTLFIILRYDTHNSFFLFKNVVTSLPSRGLPPQSLHLQDSNTILSTEQVHVSSHHYAHRTRFRSFGWSVSPSITSPIPKGSLLFIETTSPVVTYFRSPYVFHGRYIFTDDGTRSMNWKDLDPKEWTLYLDYYQG